MGILKRTYLILLLFFPFLLNGQSEGGFGYRRFSNTTTLNNTSVNNSDKNAARVGYVHSNGLYYVWDGSSWVIEENIDTFSLVNYTLRLSLRGDGQPAKTVDLSGPESFWRYFSVKTNMPFNSNDPELSFIDLQNYYSGRMGVIRVDTTVILPDDVTVTSPVQFIGEGNLDIATSKTLTFDSYVEAQPEQYIFTGDGNYEFSQTSVPFLSPHWFGANELNLDNHDQIQKTIDAAIASQIGEVKLLGGTYAISKGLLIRNGSGFVTFNFNGSSNYDDNGTTIYVNDTTNFAIGIQGARNVNISHLYLRGKQNSFNPTLAQLITTPEATYDDNLGRNSLYSPYSGIVIDPFKSGGTPADGGYPGFTSYYSTTHATSSNIKINDVVIRYFISGITVSPSGSGGNGAEISVEDCVVDRNMFGISTGSTQNRDVQVTNTVIGSSKYCMTGRRFGSQSGAMPIFSNGQMGLCKFLLDFNATIGGGKVSNTYCESVWAIGNWVGRGAPLSFTNVEIKFTTSSETGVGDSPCVLTSKETQFVMEGGSLVYSTYRPVNMHVFSGLFKGTFLNRPILNLMNNGVQENAIDYQSCKIVGYSNSQSDYRLDNVINAVDYRNTRNNFVNRNAKISYAERNGLVDPYSDHARNTVVYTQVTENKQTTKVLETKTITIDTATQTGTFTTSFPGKYRKGDILGFASNTRTPDGTQTYSDVGIVTNVSGGTITLSYVPMGLTSGSQQLELFELPIFTGTWRGNIQSGTNKLVVTSKPLTASGENASNRWPVGTRVYSKQATYTATGIPRGTYVSSVVADTIYLSSTCDSTYAEIEFFNADMRATFYSIDGLYPKESDTLRSVSFQRGDEIVFTRHPYRRKATITLGGFTPRFKFEFKNIYGDYSDIPTPESIDTGLQYFALDSFKLYVWNGNDWIGSGSSVNIFNSNGVQDDVNRLYSAYHNQNFYFGRFPNFPNIDEDGTEKGFFYSPDDYGGLGLINGDSINGDISSLFLDEDNLYLYSGQANTSTFFTLDAAHKKVQLLNKALGGIFVLGDLKITERWNDTLSFINIGHSAIGGSVNEQAAYIVMGKGGRNTDFEDKSPTRKFAIQTHKNNTTPYDWLEVEIPSVATDTTSDRIKFYNSSYAWDNNRPSPIIGDTSFHVWVGNSTGTTPMFLELDDLKTLLGDLNGIYSGDGTVPDETYARIDSAYNFALGEFPNYPDYSWGRGFYYDPGDSGNPTRDIRIMNKRNDNTAFSYLRIDQQSTYLSTKASNDEAVLTQYTSVGDVSNLLYSQRIGSPYGRNAFYAGDNTSEQLVAMSQLGGTGGVGVSAYIGEGYASSQYSLYPDRAFGVQSVITGAGFDWFQILLPNTATDTTGNNISFYNRKYYWSNETPSFTIADTSVHVWIGNGTNATPDFVEISSILGNAKNLYNSNGTTTQNTRTVNILESIKWIGTADIGVDPYPFQIISTGNEPLIQLWKGNTDSTWLKQSDVEYIFGSSAKLIVGSDDDLYLSADSIGLVGVDNKAKMRYALGLSANGIIKAFDGNAALSGDILMSNGTDWVVGSLVDNEANVPKSIRVSLTADADDYSPSGYSTTKSQYIEMEADNFWVISGIAAAIRDGVTKTLSNEGTYCIVVSKKNTGSSAANRFDIKQDIVLFPGMSATFRYDSIDTFWKTVSVSPSVSYSGSLKGNMNDVNSVTSGDNPTFNFTANGGSFLLNAPSSSLFEFRSLRLTTSGATHYPSISSKSSIFYSNSSKPYARIFAKVNVSDLSTATDDYDLRIGWNGGLIDTNSTSTSNLIVLSYQREENSGGWTIKTSNGTTLTTTNAGSPLVADDWMDIELIVYPDGEVVAFIEGNRYSTTSTLPLSAGNSFTPYVQIDKDNGTGTNHLYVHDFEYMAVMPNAE